MLNSLAPASTESSGNDENSLAGPMQKPTALVQHKGVVGFLQAFLKLQQALGAFNEGKQAEQVKQEEVVITYPTALVCNFLSYSVCVCPVTHHS